MSAGVPSEEGFHLPTQIVSPVSPKPLRFPQPSSLPVLENQMDPHFNDTATHIATLKPLPTEATRNKPSGMDFTNQSNISRMAEMDETRDGQASAGSDTDYGMSVDSNSSDENNQAASAIGTYHAHTEKVESAPVRPSDAAAQDDAESFPSPDSDLYEDDEPSNAANVPSNPVQTETQHLSSATNTANSITAVNFGALDIQALLDNITASASAPASTATPFVPVAVGSEQATDTPGPLADEAGDDENAAPVAAKSPAPLPPAAAGLPPRPPTQENANDFSLDTDIRQYHPHEQSVQVQTQALNAGNSFRPPGTLPVPQPTTGANGLPPPPIATFQQRAPSIPQQSQASPTTSTNYRQRDPLERGDTPQEGDEEEPAWDEQIQLLYDEFLTAERTYVSQGEWDKFPPNSRLFVGNLPSEKVSKKDIFSVFHKYGKLAQISIKQAYGFVQYLDAAACVRALEVEQGVLIRGRKMHLEISKPQRSNKPKNTGEDRNRNRRSRSPDYSRGGIGGNNNNNQNRGDRYRGSGGNNNNNTINNNNNRQGRVRDDYRPNRSPSPRRFRARSPDIYNGRRRSRSRSPYGPDGRRRTMDRGFEDDCPLPRRNPRDVPDIQILAKENPDRTFIGYVEKSFQARGVKADVLILSPKLDEPAVVRRQITEGVLAVMKLDRMTQMSQRFNLSIFKRVAGETKFEEYVGQDLNICVELVFREKNAATANQAQFQAPSYGVSQYGLPVIQPPQAAPQQNPYYAPHQQQRPLQTQVPANLDPNALQQILRGLPQNPALTPAQGFPQQFPPPPHLVAQQQQVGGLPGANDLARLLASAAGQQPQNPYAQQPAQQQMPNLANLAGNPALAALLAGAQRAPQGQQQGQQGQGQRQQSGSQQGGVPDMSSIMAQLARFGQQQ